MAASQRTEFKSPVGRLVMGSLYKAITTDIEGRPLQVKNGPNTGQPTQKFFFAIAIPKGERHWAETAWGQLIWIEGHKGFPQASNFPTFSWKVEDGDSTVPNAKGQKPCDREGFKGHWIIKYSGGYAPKVYRTEGSGVVQVTQEDFIKPGNLVEVLGSVSFNDQTQKPGVYINHSMVCFRGYSALGEIIFGPDPNEVGFGTAPLPAGATMMPPASSVPMPAAPLTPGAYVAAPIPAPTVPGVPILPNLGFLQVPGAPPPPPAVPAPAPSITVPAPSKMTAKAGGATYEAFKEKGWDDANLIAQGFMTV